MQRRQRIIKIIRLAWLLICFYIGFIHFSGEHFSAGYAATLETMMSIVTFPIGYLAAYLLKSLVWIFLRAHYAEMVGELNFSLALWVSMTVLGYFQWFVLVPRIWSTVRATINN